MNSQTFGIIRSEGFTVSLNIVEFLMIALCIWPYGVTSVCFPQCKYYGKGDNQKQDEKTGSLSEQKCSVLNFTEKTISFVSQTRTVKH